MAIAYNLFAPGRISFGWGRFSEVGLLASSLGRRAFVVSGSRSLDRAGVLTQLENHLREARVEPVRLQTITREPRVEDVDRLTDELPPLEDGDLVIGIGGGSALDLAKAVSAMARNRGPDHKSVKEFLEGVGAGLSIQNAPLPVLAIPTTSGTGSEATKNAVISSDRPPFKKSLRSDLMVPRSVLIDPELTVSLPAAVTAACGMDALTQLIESYISGRAQPIPRALARETIALAVSSLPRAVAEPDCREAREGMAQAALVSGMALANSGLGMAHGVAAALGISCGIAHGLACAVMLPAALEANREVRETEIAEIGRIFTGRSHANNADAARSASGAARQLGERIGIPRRLGELGVTREQIPELVERSRGNSMSANPRAIEDRELTSILEAML